MYFSLIELSLSQPPKNANSLSFNTYPTLPDKRQANLNPEPAIELKRSMATQDSNFKASPGEDSFYTPENSQFYSQNIYSKLDPKEHEIRLLTCLSLDDSGSLRCELVQNQRLADVRGIYSALSYCAGDPQKTETIFVNNIRCNIFQNLGYAIRRARHFWMTEHKDDVLALWVDQVCINQSDTRERSEQVAFMQKIYSSAEQTLVCLSTPEAEPVGQGATWLTELCANVAMPEDDVSETTWESLIWELIDNKTPQFLVDDRPNPLSGPVAPLLEFFWESMADITFANGWAEFHDLLRSPWWNRAWIFQEFIVSRQVNFLYGLHSISWKQSAQAWRFLCVLAKLVMDETFVGFFTYRYTEGFQGSDNDSQHKAERPEHRNFNWSVERLNAAADGNFSSLLECTQFMVSIKIAWSGSLDLKRLLMHSRSCKSSNDRDRVYAFVGIGDKNYRIEPDYSKTPEEILIETTKNIIKVEDSLEVLIHTSTPSQSNLHRLPSWTVDWRLRPTFWTASWTLGQLSISQDRYLELFAEYSNKQRRIRPDVSFQDEEGKAGGKICSLMQVWGVFIDVLTGKPTSSDDPYALCSLPSKNYQLKVDSVPGTRPDQELWILYGARFPLVLQPAGDAYMLVAPVMVFDKGEHFDMNAVLDKVEKGFLSRERISIR